MTLAIIRRLDQPLRCLSCACWYFGVPKSLGSSTCSPRLGITLSVQAHTHARAHTHTHTHARARARSYWNWCRDTFTGFEQTLDWQTSPWRVPDHAIYLFVTTTFVTCQQHKNTSVCNVTPSLWIELNLLGHHNFRHMPIKNSILFVCRSKFTSPQPSSHINQECCIRRYALDLVVCTPKSTSASPQPSSHANRVVYLTLHANMCVLTKTYFSFVLYVKFMLFVCRSKSTFTSQPLSHANCVVPDNARHLCADQSLLMRYHCPGAGIMEANDSQVTPVFTVQPSFHHRHSTNRVAWSVTTVGERAVTPHLVVCRRW